MCACSYMYAYMRSCKRVYLCARVSAICAVTMEYTFFVNRFSRGRYWPKSDTHPSSSLRGNSLAPWRHSSPGVVPAYSSWVYQILTTGKPRINTECDIWNTHAKTPFAVCKFHFAEWDLSRKYPRYSFTRHFSMSLSGTNVWSANWIGSFTSHRHGTHGK